MNEIKTNNEVVTMNEMNEYFEKLVKKVGLTQDKYHSTRFTNTTFINEYHYEADFGYMNVYAKCGIRTMGMFTIEDMNTASEEIKSIAKVVEIFNERMDGVKVVLN